MADKTEPDATEVPAEERAAPEEIETADEEPSEEAGEIVELEEPQPETGAGVPAESDLEPEPDSTPVEAEVTEPALAPAPRRRSVVLPAVAGGVLGAILGFIAERSDVVNNALPASLRLPDYEARISALEADTARNAQSATALSARVDAIRPADLSPLEAAVAQLRAKLQANGDALAALNGDLADLAGRLDDLAARVVAVEKRPLESALSEEAIAAYERELADITASVVALKAETQALLARVRDMASATEDQRASAEAAARAADLRERVSALRLAVASGAPFATELDTVRALDVAVPRVLADTAKAGVASMAVLSSGFAPAARRALAAARAANPGDGGIGGFLRRQLGARSVAPRAGDDPDAVLSRAEAALRGGDVAAALDELKALPPEAAAEMAAWSDLARTRLAALAAVDTLAAPAGGN